jgi:hypothetical protein
MEHGNTPGSFAKILASNPPGGDFAADRRIQIEPPQAEKCGGKSAEPLVGQGRHMDGGSVLFDLGHVTSVGRWVLEKQMQNHDFSGGTVFFRRLY